MAGLHTRPMRSCPHCGQANADDAQSCRVCGTRLSGGWATSGDVRKTVTILFADVTGSTDLGERIDAEALRSVMFRFFDEMRDVLERHGGTVEKFAGDDVMAVFGVPTLHEDDALRAVHAASAMHESLAGLNEELERAWGVRLEVRIGINTGEVITGGELGEKTLATGDPVNLAKRIQQAAEPGQILLGKETYRLVRHDVQAGELESFSIKERTVSPWRLMDAQSPAMPRPESPLVGRDEELRALLDRYDGVVAEQRCRMVTVLGPAGVGKSRLALELRERLRDATVAIGRCLPYGEGITFWPVREIVRHTVGIDPDDDIPKARAKIAALLQGDEQAEVVGEATAAAVGIGADPTSTDEIFWALRRFLETAARGRPLVVLVEDIHWAEPTLLDLLDYLEGWARNAPILIVCLARPELLELRPTWATGETIRLEPLTEAETHQLVTSIAPEAGPGLAARVWDAAEGNPLFAEEMLHMLLESGNGDSTEAPPTINALLAARLDRLPSDERTVIQCASVIGRQFGWTEVTELVPADLRERVPAVLQALVRKGMLRPDEPTSVGEDALRFGHILMRDAAYRALPKGSRAELHERFAAWLEQRVGDRAVEFEEILGYHLEQAYRTRIELGPPDDRAQQVAVRAGMRLASAGDRALAREDIPAAIKLLERGTFLLAQDGERSSAALLNLGTAVREAGDLARADELLGNAIDAAEAAEWPHLRARALVERSSLRAFIDRNVQADDLLHTADGAIEVFERESDELGLAKAWIHVSEVHWMRCRCDEMEDVLERALEHARQARASREVSTILTALSRAALVGPRPAADGIARCRQLRERALGTSPTLYAEGDYLMAALEAMRGRFDEARALIESGRRLLEEYGLRVRLASLPMYGAMIELWAGDPAAAERELRSAYDSLARMGERSYLSTIAGFLARALVEQGRHAEAEEKARISADSASADDVGTQIIWRGTCARALSRQGRRDEAERLATEAVELSSGIDFVTVKADATCDLANVLHDLGRRDESLPIFSDALKIYEDKGNVVAAGRVRAQLQAAESATA